MDLHTLPSIVARKKKRLGRGVSSGRGKTAGRGHKGAKARGRMPLYKEGGGRRSRLIKHLPQLRGIGNPAVSPKPAIITLRHLDSYFHSGDVVNFDSVLEKGIVRKAAALKVLHIGTLTKPLIVRLPVSAAAREVIERVGGRVEYV